MLYRSSHLIGEQRVAIPFGVKLASQEIYNLHFEIF